MLRKIFSLILLAVLAGSAATAADKRPNILLILADDMGFSDAACYGGDIATPQLDTLAKGGVRFTQFYNTARCWPSRAAILTGYYAQQVRRDAMPGMQGGARGVRPAWARLLPEMLRPTGYRAYHSGKWHVDGKPLQNGFDHSYSLEDHDRNFAPRRHTEDDQPRPAVATNANYFTSTAMADHAIKCLKEHAEKFSDRPFFSFLAFTSPHFPLQAPAADIARYQGKFAMGWDVVRNERFERQTAMGLVSGPMSATEQEVGPPYHFAEALAKLGPGEVNRPLPWCDLNAVQKEFQAAKMAIHAAMIDRMDQEIGRVLAQIKAMGAFEDTLVLFLSDNGASAEIMVRGDGHDPQAAPGSAATFLCLGPGWSSAANTPLRRHKTWVHEGGISSPLIAHWPRGIAARGELRHTPAHLVDLVPTILEITGAKPLPAPAGKPAPPAPGRSLTPAFAREVVVPRESLWWSHEGNRALRVGDWKLVASGANSPWELYNLKTDRAETRDLATAEPAKVRELGELWERQAAEIRAVATRDLPPGANGNPGTPNKKRGNAPVPVLAPAKAEK